VLTGASLVVTFAAGVAVVGSWRSLRWATGTLIATFHRDAPARCSFADARRIVAGAEGGRVRTRNAHSAR
jgi:hypothetical protein